MLWSEEDEIALNRLFLVKYEGTRLPLPTVEPRQYRRKIRADDKGKVTVTPLTTAQKKHLQDVTTRERETIFEEQERKRKEWGARVMSGRYSPAEEPMPLTPKGLSPIDIVTAEALGSLLPVIENAQNFIDSVKQAPSYFFRKAEERKQAIQAVERPNLIQKAEVPFLKTVGFAAMPALITERTIEPFVLGITDVFGWTQDMLHAGISAVVNPVIQLEDGLRQRTLGEKVELLARPTFGRAAKVERRFAQAIQDVIGVAPQPLTALTTAIGVKVDQPRISLQEAITGKPKERTETGGGEKRERIPSFGQFLYDVGDIVLDPSLWVSFGSVGAMKLVTGLPRAVKGTEVAVKITRKGESVVQKMLADEALKLADEGKVVEVIAALRGATAKEAEKYSKAWLDRNAEKMVALYADRQVQIDRFHRYTDPVTGLSTGATEDEIKYAQAFVAKNIDTGHLKLSPLFTKVQMEFGQALRRRLPESVAVWTTLREEEVFNKVHEATLPLRKALYSLQAKFDIRGTKFGRVPEAFYRHVRTMHNEETFMNLEGQNYLYNLARQNDLTEQQANLVFTALFSETSIANPTLETLRLKILSDPVLEADFKSGVKLRHLVNYLTETGQVSTEGEAFTVIRAIREGLDLKDETLEFVREKIQNQFSEMLREAQWHGVDIKEAMGGGYVPRIPAPKDVRIEWEKAQARAEGEPIDEFFDETVESWHRARSEYGTQGAQKHRSVYTFVSIDENGNVLKQVATPKTLAGKKTTLDRFVQTLTQKELKRQLIAQREVDRILSHLDTLEVRTGGKTLEQIRQELADVQKEIARWEHVKGAEKDVKMLIRKRERLGSISERLLARYPDIPDIMTIRQDLRDSVSLLRDLTRQHSKSEVLMGLYDDAAKAFESLNWNAIEMNTAKGTEFFRWMKARKTIEKIGDELLDPSGIDEWMAGFTDIVQEQRQLLEKARESEQVFRDWYSVQTRIETVEKRIVKLRNANLTDDIANAKKELRTLLAERKVIQSQIQGEASLQKAYQEITLRENNIANSISAFMERVPKGAQDIVWIQKKRAMKAGILDVGDEVILTKTGEKGHIVDHLMEEPAESAEWRLPRPIRLSRIEDLTSLDKNNLRVLVQKEDGTQTILRLSEVKPPPNYSNINVYTIEKAFEDEVNDEWGPLFDTNIIRAASSRIKEQSRMVSVQDFTEALREEGWVEKEHLPGWVEIEANIPQIRGMFASKPIAEYLMLMSKAPVENGWTRFFDGFNAFWKTGVTALWPGFHGQNLLSNVALNFYDITAGAFNPRTHAMASHLLYLNHKAEALEALSLTGKLDVRQDAENALRLLNEQNVVTDATGKVWKLGDLRQTLKETDVAFTKQHFGLLDMDSPIYQDVLRASTQPETPLTEKIQAYGTRGLQKLWQTPGMVGRKVGNIVEDEARLVLWLTNMQRTGNVQQSSQRVRQFLFDYQELTPFERGVLRRIIPFYTFAKKNLALHASLALKEPGKLEIQRHLVNALQNWLFNEDPLTEEEMSQTSSYMQSGLRMVVDRKDGSTTIMNTGGLPVMSAFNLVFQPTKALGNLTPFLKMPLEELTQFHLFFGEDFPTRMDITTPYQLIKDLPFTKEASNALFDWLDVEEVKTSSGERRIMSRNPQMAYALLNAPPLSRFWTELNTLRSGVKSIKEDYNVAHWGTHTLDALFGFGFSHLTPTDKRRIQAAFLRRIRAEKLTERKGERLLQETEQASRSFTGR